MSRICPIRDFPGYFVGTNGNVWSKWKRIGRKGHGRLGTEMVLGNELVMLRSFPNKDGYLKVNLYRGGKVYPRLVHKLVLETFIGPCPAGMESCHKDGDAGNPRKSNLYWGTHSQNMQDCIRHGKFALRGSTHPMSKLSENDVLYVVHMLRVGISQKEVARDLNVSPSTIQLIAAGKNWNHLTETLSNN